MARAREVDVLIVGAGPTGLTAAVELARRGVPFRIIDKEPQRSDKSRALVVHARSLEVLNEMGLADLLIGKGRKAVTVNLHSSGRRLARIEFSHIGAMDCEFPFVLFVSQAETEAVLENRLRELGGAVERPLGLEGLAEDSGGVTAGLSDGTSCRCRYVIGADGAHSQVRKSSGLEFAGAAYPQDFFLADLNLEWDLALGEIHMFLGAKGVLACLPLPGRAAHRIVAALGRKSEPGSEDPTLDEMTTLVRAHTGHAAVLSQPRWLARFRLHHRGVEHYRQGRVFLAGDAAHIHSPAGGQGMNTGIQDAFNLAWKVALVANLRAPEGLLESYEEERLPVGRRLLRFTDRFFQVLSSPNPLLSWLRAWIIPRLAPWVLARPERRRRGLRFVSQLGIKYPQSSLNGGHRPHPGCGLGPRPGPGDRAPDGPLEKGWLFRSLAGQEFRLLIFCERQDSKTPWEQDLEERAAPWANLLRITKIPRAENRLWELYGLSSPAWFLLRPDNHVSVRGCDSGELTRYLETILKPGTP